MLDHHRTPWQNFMYSALKCVHSYALIFMHGMLVQEGIGFWP